MRATLALSGRSDLLRLQHIISCEDPARMLPEPSIEQHTRALELLGLSRQQQQRLADGYMVFHGMINTVLVELQGVQQQQHSQQQPQRQHLQQLRAASGLSSMNTGCRGSGSSTSDSSDSNGSAAGYGRLAVRVGLRRARRLLLQLQQHILARALQAGGGYGAHG